MTFSSELSVDRRVETQLVEYDSLATNEEYWALVRALRRKQGFGLFFVQAQQGDRLLSLLRRDLAGKSFAEIRLQREDEELYDKLDLVWQQARVDIFWIEGLEQSLLGYEDIKRRLGWEEEEVMDYSYRDVPPILSHLNLGRERLVKQFDCIFIFMVPLFAVRYLLKRAADFFDWRSGFFEFADSSEVRQKFVQNVIEEADYKSYENLTIEDRDEKIFRIEDQLSDAELDIETQSKLWREIGRLFGSGKQHERAITAFKRSLEANPNYGDAWRNLGSACDDLGRYDEAEEALKKAIDLDSTDADAYNNLGIVYQSQGRHEEAIRIFSSAIEIDETHKFAWSNRGESYRLINLRKEALHDLNHAIELDNNVPWAMVSRAQIYEELEHYEEALKDFDRAIELNSRFFWAISHRGMLQYKLKHYEAALKNFDRVIELEPTAWALDWRGCIYQWMHRYEEALEDFKNAIKLNPNDAYAYTGLGDTYSNQKSYGEAMKAYQRVIALNPEDATAYSNLGIAYKAQKRYEEAITAYERAIALNPEYARAFANRGEAYRLTKRYDEALKDFDLAIELDSEYSWAIASRGQTYQALKRYEKALKDFDRAIEIDPENDYYLYLRALAHLKLNQPEPAETDFQKAITITTSQYEKDPIDWRNTFNLALYHLAAGHHEESDRLYTSNLTAPIEYLQMAISDLDDFLHLFPDHTQAQQVKQLLQGAILVTRGCANEATQPIAL